MVNRFKTVVFMPKTAYGQEVGHDDTRVGVIFMGYSILQEILQDAVRFFGSCTAKLKEVSSKSVQYQF